MRELVVENQEVLIIPQDFKQANRGVVTSVSAGDFTMELEEEPTKIMVNTFCEFYTQTPRGKLYFDSYAKEINGKTLVIASPAKHKFLQRRQYTRIKFVQDFEINCGGKSFKITTLDLSAGGMKFKTSDNIDINAVYDVLLPISDEYTVSCTFEPIRIEKSSGEYVVSGQFAYKTTHDKMMIVQFCAKRSVEIRNK